MRFITSHNLWVYIKGVISRRDDSSFVELLTEGQSCLFYSLLLISMVSNRDVGQL